MDEILLLTLEGAGQAGDDLLIFPALPADHYSFGEIERIKVVTPDQLVIEKDAEFSIPFDSESRVCLLLIPNAQKDEIPVGSQILIK